MEKALDIFHNDYYSHPTGDLSWFFIVRTCWGFLEAKPIEVWGLPKTAASSSHASPYSISSISSKLLFVSLWFQWLLLQVSRSWLWLPSFTSLQISGWWAACNLSSMISPRKVIIFQFIQLFLVVRMDMTTSKLFIFWGWNWKSFWSLIFKQTYCYIRWTSN